MPTFDFYAKRMETTVETKPQKTETKKKFGLPTNKQKRKPKILVSSMVSILVSSNLLVYSLL